MEFLTPIIFIVIFILIVRANSKANKKKQGSNPGVNPQWNLAAWQNAAHELKAHFQVPKAKGELPAIMGKRNGFSFHIRPEKDDGYSLNCSVKFPRSIGEEIQIVFGPEDTVRAIARKTPPFKISKCSDGLISYTAAHNKWLVQYLQEENRMKDLETLASGAGSFFIKETGMTVMYFTADGDPVPQAVQFILALAQKLVPSEEKQPAAKPAPASAPQPASKPAPAPAVKQPAITVTPQVQPAPVPKQEPVRRPATITLEPQVLCDALFRNAMAGKAEKEDFAKVKGKRVEWQGKLLFHYEYEFDYMFGNRKGIKAALELQAEGLHQPIRILLSLPRTDGEFLRNNREQVLTFRGDLLQFETFSRELYLDNGELLNGRCSA